MGVSTSGTRTSSLTRIATAALVLAAIGSVAFYLYGPAVTPALRAGAVAECNKITGGSYRSFDLDWVVSARPHWSCHDRRNPAEPPVDLGWWVNPNLWGRL